MERCETCPDCRHVVEFGPDQTVRKCPNCGRHVTFDTGRLSRQHGRRDPSAAPDVYTAPLAPRPQTVSGAVPLADPPVPPKNRTAAIVALIFSLLFFIPFVTQLIAVASALVAILRPRRADQRVTLAWVALVVSLLVMTGWWQVLNTWGPRMTGTWTTMTYTSTTPTSEEDYLHASALVETMKRIHRAASGYRRDFGHWPERVDDLIGQSLPRGFTMPDELHYRPVPDSKVTSFDWILIVSGPVSYDRDGNRLSKPHRLLIRTGGKIELLPSTHLDSLLSEPEGEKNTPGAGNENGG